MTIQELKANRCFKGWNKQYSHYSNVLNCEMRFSIFLPEKVNHHKGLPVLYWLSGLTCTDENFMLKAGAQRVASELGIAIVAPDTSPRGNNIADDEAYDLGTGAGFYVNATQQPWKQHYQMYDYVVNELPSIIESAIPVSNVRSISGHSMGGHGALTIALKNPDKYRSVSAFSPISNPVNCAWGKKAFTAYLGENEANWLNHDASELIKDANQHLPMLVELGNSDEYLEDQLRPHALERAAKHNNYPLELKIYDGYDHSYFFIASFIERHIKFHAKHLFS